MGWVSLLQNEYIRSADVIVRGVSGYNTKWFLKYVMPTIEDEIRDRGYTTPSLVTVLLGTNDAVLVNGSNPEVHVPIFEYKENLIKIVNGFQNITPGAGILLITPPHVDDGARIKYASERNDTKRGLVDRSNAVTSNYSQACVDAANALGIPVLDLNAHFNAMTEPARIALLQDGLHFNANGNKIVHELLQSKIETEFPTLSEKLSTWQSPAASKYVVEDPWTAGASQTP
ncbi:GDSL esterase/lipase [Phytophthora cinnamomi]|uniref:GDSL esterase/lipase n=1 Tax=Phytophthora cinnamomi TaxID=4785 RepID=UPI003559AD32|nr:GDSL esterase/lipase [Phytophthora cinnamomi]